MTSGDPVPGLETGVVVEREANSPALWFFLGDFGLGISGYSLKFSCVEEWLAQFTG